MQIRLYIIIAVLSGEERDIKALRSLISLLISECGTIQVGILILVAEMSGKEFDLKRARRAIEKEDSFGQVQQHLRLFRTLGQQEDLQSARRAAETEVEGKPFFKTASLTIVAGFTGNLDDFRKMEQALRRVDESSLLRRMPGDVNIGSIIAKSNDFQSAWMAVEWIDDEYLRAMVWTLIGLSRLKIFTTVVTVG